MLFTAFNNRFFSTSLFQPISSLTVQVYTYAVSPYDDWHRQAWAGALVLVGLYLHFLGARTRGDPPPRKDAPNMSDTAVSDMQAPTETPAGSPGPDERSAPGPAAMVGRRLRMESKKLNFSYGAKQALWDISLRIPERTVTAFIGPSGCGKSTFSACLNRMNDIIPDTRVDGDVLLDGHDIYGPGTDVVDLRRRVGMVFQKSNPFPKSIFENVAYGLGSIGMCTALGAGGARGEGPAPRGALGRGQGPARHVRPWACRAGSSSGCASRGPSRSSRRCC